MVQGEEANLPNLYEDEPQKQSNTASHPSQDRPNSVVVKMHENPSKGEESQEAINNKKHSMSTAASIANLNAPALVQTTRKQMGMILFGVVLGVFLAALDQTIVATALPRIIADFGQLNLYSWVIASYLLTSTAVVPLCGKFSDIFGRKILFQGAITIFLIGSVLCGISMTMKMLIVFRAIQGIGGGAIMSISQIIISDITTVQDRGKYGAMIGLTFGVSSVLGPVLGGVITDGIGWKWIFFLNIPFAIAAFLVIQFGLTVNVKKSTGTFRERLHEIDFIGVFLIVAGLVGLLLAVSFGGNTYAWKSAPVIVLFCVGGVLLILFVLNEQFWTKQPIIVMRQFRNKNVTLCNLIAFCLGFGMFASLSYLPLYFQNVIGDSPTISGLKLIANMIGLMIGSIFSGIFIAKVGFYYQFLVLGPAFTTLAFGLLYLIEVGWNYGRIFPILVVLGLGLGLQVQTVTIVTQFFSERKDIAIATATVTLSRTLGGVVGVAVFGSLITQILKEKLPANLVGPASAGWTVTSHITPESTRQEILHGYNDTLRVMFVAAAPVMFIALVLALFVTRVRIRMNPPPGAKGEAAEPLPMPVEM